MPLLVLLRPFRGSGGSGLRSGAEVGASLRPRPRPSHHPHALDTWILSSPRQLACQLGIVGLAASVSLLVVVPRCQQLRAPGFFPHCYLGATGLVEYSRGHASAASSPCKSTVGVEYGSLQC